AYSKLVWSHKGNKVATNGKGAALLRPVTRGKTPDQFSNWSSASSNLKLLQSASLTTVPLFFGDTLTWS
ncbi:MAG: hypothetical protein FWD31_13125, partial [Planctomycetaceae bacterium]|nr:hypothetical protein [Planctomycetaceae bacterium]